MPSVESSYPSAICLERVSQEEVDWNALFHVEWLEHVLDTMKLSCYIAADERKLDGFYPPSSRQFHPSCFCIIPACLHFVLDIQSRVTQRYMVVRRRRWGATGRGHLVALVNQGRGLRGPTILFLTAFTKVLLWWPVASSVVSSSITLDSN